MNDWLTLDQAEALTGRDEAEIYIAMRRGQIVPALRRQDPPEWRVDKAALLAWAEAPAS